MSTRQQNDNMTSERQEIAKFSAILTSKVVMVTLYENHGVFSYRLRKNCKKGIMNR